MPRAREIIRRYTPSFLRAAVISTRARLNPEALEDIKVHSYEIRPDTDESPRLNLIIPSVSPGQAFGGVTTGLELFLGLGKKSGAEMRILVDDFGPVDRSVVDKYAQVCGLDPKEVIVVGRFSEVPVLPVRSSDVFISFNWWTTLNIRALLLLQSKLYGRPVLPYLYLIQEYDPSMYPFSSTHMMARLAFDLRGPCWGIFNSPELFTFYNAQGHAVTRSYVFEAQLAHGLRPLLELGPVAKTRRVLVYGRPAIPRNCYSAVENGLRTWTSRFPEFSDWEIVSAGLAHPPLRLSSKRYMRSLGKLSLSDYGELLRTTAVGLSLMASPHTSYPPLEMAHFGIRTLTNSYPCKTPSNLHENIVELPDIAPDTIADALAASCLTFEANPAAGWSLKSLRTSFLNYEPLSILSQLAEDLHALIWKTT